MKDEVLKDEKFFWERMNFVNYLTMRRIVLVQEEQMSSSSSGDSYSVKKNKELLQPEKQGYLDYEKRIRSKFDDSGVETVRAIALGFAVKKSKMVTDPIGESSKDRLVAIDDGAADVCVSLARWEYEAGHFKRVRWTAYIAASALVAGSIMPIIELFSSIIDLLSKWVL